MAKIKTSKTALCPSCNAELSSKDKFCPSCGAKIKKPLNKKLLIIIAAVAAVALIVGLAVGLSGNKEKKLYGTWTAKTAVVNGTEFNAEQLKVATDYDLSQKHLLLQKNGTAYVCDNGEVTKYLWSFSDDEVRIGEAVLEYKDNRLFLTNGKDVTFVFEKDSDSQTLPEGWLENKKPDAENQNSEPDTEPPTEKLTESTDLVNGMRPEFKATMDSYEKFFDEYVAFMKKFSDSKDIMSMYSDYMKFLSKYTEMMSSMEKLGDENLNTAEMQYYIEVTARIEKKLLEVANVAF